MIRGRYLTSVDDLTDVLVIRRASLDAADPESARDEFDEMCVYALALDQDGRAVGTGRLYIDADSRFRLGRLCVLPGVKEYGLEDLMARMLLFRAQDLNAGSVRTLAEEAQIPFFAQYGFRAEPETRQIAGRRMVEMAVAGDGINLEGTCGGHCPGKDR